MPFIRRILHYSPGPSDLIGPIAERAVAGAWFELHRQGGCGAGELRLYDEFPHRHAIDLGDWIAFEYENGARWYLGRVEQRLAASPAGVRFRLEGMSAELAEVFPGGFARHAADGVPPHHYARTDLFPHDPDHFDQTFDTVSEPAELVALLLQQYVVPRTHIGFLPAMIEAPVEPAVVASLKFRGEESVRAVVKELALRARNASWGVDASGRFFFLRPRADILATYREGTDVLRLDETRDREFLFNRVLLTGDYVYDEPVHSDMTARGFYRWRGNYIQPASRSKYGERRIRIWVPWIRTATDSREFTREFFRVYADPTTRYLVEVADKSLLPRPWLGRVRLLDRTGHELITAAIETLHVQFDHVPRFRMELGPDDPRIHWPEPPHDERWEVGESNQAGDQITLPPTDSTTQITGSSGDVSSDWISSDFSSDFSSNVSSATSLDESQPSGPHSSFESGATSFDSSVSFSDGSETAETSNESSAGTDSFDSHVSDDPWTQGGDSTLSDGDTTGPTDPSSLGTSDEWDTISDTL